MSFNPGISAFRPSFSYSAKQKPAASPAPHSSQSAQPQFAGHHRRSKAPGIIAGLSLAMMGPLIGLGYAHEMQNTREELYDSIRPESAASQATPPLTATDNDLLAIERTLHADIAEDSKAKTLQTIDRALEKAQSPKLKQLQKDSRQLVLDLADYKDHAGISREEIRTKAAMYLANLEESMKIHAQASGEPAIFFQRLPGNVEGSTSTIFCTTLRMACIFRKAC
jgi:hypothetical protein